jgi:pSer/pThr/pTyr-binding forkhead associated (FHA) protein
LKYLPALLKCRAVVAKTRIFGNQQVGYYVAMSKTFFTGDFSPQQKGAFLIINKQMIPLTKNITTFGRQLENDIVFHEDFLSRFHAEIVHEDDHYVLYDKESTSGTFVNGRQVDQCVLNSGDLISLANILIMFVNNDSKIAGKTMGTTQSLQQKGPRIQEKL